MAPGQEPRVEHVTPYGASEEKGTQVEEMFDSIAPAYDRMNTLMSFGCHRRWRDRALAEISGEASLSGERRAERGEKERATLDILDVAAGTGDLSFELARLMPDARVTGADISAGMLDVARRKLKTLPEDIRERITFEQADCLQLPYGDCAFDIVTVAYGVRNFSNLLQGLREMHRVLRPGGTLCVIELSCPVNPLLRLGYDLYCRLVIPLMGKILSGDRRAYAYLPQSIAACPQRGDMAALMSRAGFSGCRYKSLTLGVVTYYIAKK